MCLCKQVNLFPKTQIKVWSLVYNNMLYIYINKMNIHIHNNILIQEHIWDVYHPLAGLDQCTRATLNAVLWVEMAKSPWRSTSMPPIFNTICKNAKMHIWCKFGGSLWPNDPEHQGQWPPFSIPADSIPECMFGANLVNRAYIYDELSCVQAKCPRILSQNSQNDLEGQGQWPLFSIPAENIPWCMFGANLVIPAQICEDLCCGQSKVYGRTDGRADRRTDGWTDRQRDTGNNNIPSAWKAKG